MRSFFMAAVTPASIVAITILGVAITWGITAVRIAGIQARASVASVEALAGKVTKADIRVSQQNQSGSQLALPALPATGALHKKISPRPSPRPARTVDD